MIICAAVRFTVVNNDGDEDSIMVCGHRHPNCFKVWRYIQPHIKSVIQEVQGFMTDKGDFLDRISARKHFVECGQGTPEWDDELDSLDLY